MDNDQSKGSEHQLDAAQENLSSELSVLQKRLGISQARMAELAGLSERRLRDALRGRSVGTKAVEKLNALLCRPLEILIQEIHGETSLRGAETELDKKRKFLSESSEFYCVVQPEGSETIVLFASHKGELLSSEAIRTVAREMCETRQTRWRVLVPANNAWETADRVRKSAESCRSKIWKQVCHYQCEPDGACPAETPIKRTEFERRFEIVPFHRVEYFNPRFNTILRSTPTSGPIVRLAYLEVPFETLNTSPGLVQLSESERDDIEQWLMSGDVHLLDA